MVSGERFSLQALHSVVLLETLQVMLLVALFSRIENAVGTRPLLLMPKSIQMIFTRSFNVREAFGFLSFNAMHSHTFLHALPEDERLTPSSFPDCAQNSEWEIGLDGFGAACHRPARWYASKVGMKESQVRIFDCRFEVICIDVRRQV